MIAEQFDIVVIGGGCAGSSATNTAIQHGGRIALVEEHRLGGT
jgi:pyruvate/2-oxoglutarate dehydrogenase complex dihydrolipoamide dehydrogenase (E3) component